MPVPCTGYKASFKYDMPSRDSFKAYGKVAHDDDMIADTTEI